MKWVILRQCKINTFYTFEYLRVQFIQCVIALHFLIFVYKKWANPGLFFIYFRSVEIFISLTFFVPSTSMKGLFQINNTIFTTNKCEKCPSSIWHWDSNPRPIELFNLLSNQSIISLIKIFYSIKLKTYLENTCLIYFLYFKSTKPWILAKFLLKNYFCLKVAIIWLRKKYYLSDVPAEYYSKHLILQVSNNDPTKYWAWALV